MIKKTITFPDLEGNPVTEDFWFHLNKADVAELELGTKGGLDALVRRIIKEEDGAKIVEIFKDLIKRSIGRRHEDGKQFIRNQQIVDEFMQTEAYSELFVELGTNADKAAEFIKGLVPAGMQAEIEKLEQKNAVENVALPEDGESTSTLSVAEQIEKKFEDPSWVPTPGELQKMTPEQLQRAFQRKNSAPPA